MSAPFGSCAKRCMGCHPARARAEPERSSAERKSCDMNGLYGEADAHDGTVAAAAPGVAPAPLPRAGLGGLAQASQASAVISPRALATRRVNSVVAMARRL